MRLRRLCLLLAAAAICISAPARAALLIEIDKSAQRMTVSEDRVPLYVWPVSTGKGSQYDTPSGDYKPFRMEKDHFSREWDDAPMPNSIFFTQIGHAIHGTTDEKNLGRPASHGCVRLSRANSEILWGLVKKNKMANTRVVLYGNAPAVSDAPAVAKRNAPRDDGSYRPYDDRGFDRYGDTSDDERVYRDQYGRTYVRRYDNYSQTEEFTGSARRVPRSQNAYRESYDGQRYYYYREQPYQRQRYYYRDTPPFPFGN